MAEDGGPSGSSRGARRAGARVAARAAQQAAGRIDVVDLLGSDDDGQTDFAATQVVAPVAEALAAARGGAGDTPETLPRAAAAAGPPPAAAPAPSAGGAAAGGDDAEGAACSICYDALTDGPPHRAAALRCGHIFGESCVRRWLSEGKRRCPQCNHKARPRDVTPLFNLPVAVAPAPAPRPEDAAQLAALRRQLDLERAQAERERRELEGRVAALSRAQALAPVAVAPRAGGALPGFAEAPPGAAGLGPGRGPGGYYQRQQQHHHHHQQQQQQQQQQPWQGHNQWAGPRGSLASGGGPAPAQFYPGSHTTGVKRPADALGGEAHGLGPDARRPAAPQSAGPGTAAAWPAAAEGAGPRLRLEGVPPWAAGAAPAAPAAGGLAPVQTYKCSGSRTFCLSGSMLLLAESPVAPGGNGGGGGGGGDQRLRKVSVFVPGSPSHVLLPGAGRVCALAAQLRGGMGGLVAAGTQRGGVMFVSCETGTVVHRLSLPAGTCAWSVAWSPDCEQQLLIGMDRGRLALADLRMTGRECKGLVAAGAAPGVQQPLLRVAALRGGGGSGGGAACVAAAPGGVYAWSELGDGSGGAGGGGGFTRLLDARVAHGGNCESVALWHGDAEGAPGCGAAAEAPLVCVSMRSPLAAPAGPGAAPPAAAAHLLYRLVPADGPGGTAVAAAAPGAAAALTGHASRHVVTCGDFVRLPAAGGGGAGGATAFFSGDERGNTVAAWDCATGAQLLGGGGGGGLPGPLVQVSGGRLGGGGTPLIGGLCESQLTLWQWDAAAAPCV